MAHRCEAEREQRAATGLTRPRQAGSVRVCSGGPAQRAAQPCHQTDHDRPGDRSRQCGDEGEVGHRDRRRPQAAGLGQSGAGQPAAYRQRQRGGARAGSEAADDPAEPGRAPAPVGGDQREADVERPGEGELAAAVVLGADGRAFARRRSPAAGPSRTAGTSPAVTWNPARPSWRPSPARWQKRPSGGCARYGGFARLQARTREVAVDIDYEVRLMAQALAVVALPGGHPDRTRRTAGSARKISTG